MKKIAIILFMLCFVSMNSSSQNTENKISTHFVKINEYRKLFGNDLSKVSKKDFVYNQGDTLIKFKGIVTPYEFKDSTFLDIYKDVVYRKNRKFKGSTKPIMTLWDGPIKIFFSKSVDTTFRNSIIEVSNVLSRQIDSLNISFVDDIEKSNYIIYQIDKDNKYKYSKNIKNNRFIDYYSYWNQHKIYDTKFEINVSKIKNPRKVKPYVVQYFLRSLGHFDITKKLSCEHMFSRCLKSKKKLSDIDIEIIKYHYSYGICKWTDLSTFEENHKRAKEALEKGNRLTFLHPIK